MLGDSTSPLLWNSSGASLDAQALAVWSAYTGQDERGADNWGWLNALHPADRASVREAWQQVEHGPHVFSLVYRIQQGKAEYHPFKVLNVPVFNDAQQLQGWLVFFGAAAAPSPVRDEHWELRLINSMIYTQMVLGILCLSLDGAVLRANNRLCQLTGYTEAELLSRTLWQLSMPEDVHLQLQAMRERLVRDQSYPPFRIRYRRKDGTPIWVRVTEFLVHLPSGEPYYFFYVVEDVSSEVLAEEERAELLTRVQNSFKMLLALAEELVDIPKSPSAQSVSGSVLPALPFQAISEYMAELTCQMLKYESTSILLLEPETSLYRMTAMAGFQSEQKALYYEKMPPFPLSNYLDESAIALLRANEVVIRELTLRFIKPRRYNALVAPMILNGRLVGVLTAKRSEASRSYTQEEISLVKAVAKFVLLVIERERMQQEWIEAHTNELALRETNRRFDEFLSIASHELRTPLAGIKGNIQLAQRRLAFLKEPESPEKDVLLEKLEKVRDYLLHAEHRVNVQNRMISDLLDVSRIQANKLDLVLHPCNLAEIVRDAVEDQRYTATERVITFTVPANEDFTVVGDADRLGQVVHNYLTNALKYSPVDRPVTVSLEILDSTVRVSVRDEGPGLSPEEQKHVWERFYRVKGIPAQGEAPPGLGLGLHICRTILDAHHGSFGLESVPGEGSTFWFALPLACSSTDTSSPETRGDFTAQTCFDV